MITTWIEIGFTLYYKTNLKESWCIICTQPQGTVNNSVFCLSVQLLNSAQADGFRGLHVAGCALTILGYVTGMTPLIYKENLHQLCVYCCWVPFPLHLMFQFNYIKKYFNHKFENDIFPMLLHKRNNNTNTHGHVALDGILSVAWEIWIFNVSSKKAACVLITRNVGQLTFRTAHLKRKQILLERERERVELYASFSSCRC